MNNSAHSPENNLDNQEFIKVLSDYFTHRGRFLAQIISADIRNFPSSHNQNIQSSLKSNNFSSENGHSQNSLESNNFSSANGHSQNSLESNNFSSANGHNQNSLESNNFSSKDANVKEEKTIPLSSPSNETELLESSLQDIPEQTIGIDVEALLIDLVVQQTGYSSDSIELDAKLLEDLSLDSIKAGELIATAAKECGVAGDIDPSSLANSDLQEIADAIRSAMPNKPDTKTTQIKATKSLTSTSNFSILESPNPKDILSKLEHLSEAEVDSLLASNLP